MTLESNFWNELGGDNDETILDFDSVLVVAAEDDGYFAPLTPL